jgi:uncharacterized membrane protein
VNVRQLLDRVRDSLLYVPAAFIVASLVLAWIANRLDATTDTSDLFYLLPTSISAARTLLGTVAGATITVAALVFSITAVTVQLSATQYSPRVLQGFLRDRYQQVVVGFVMGTFTYSLVSLATAGNALRDPEVVDASFAATIGLALGVVSALAIVAFIDHVTRRIRVDDTIRRLTAATTRSIEAAFNHAETAATPMDGWEIDREATPLRVHAIRSGWAQEIHSVALLTGLPPGAIGRIDVTVGDYVAKGDPLLSVWLPGDADDARVEHVGRHAIELGDARTIEDDPRFGIRQLVDIALRALSPGINDPATAADVVRHLVEPMRSAAHQRARRRVHRNDAGTRIVMPAQPDAGDYVHLGFGEIRLAAADQPLVLKALVDSLAKLWRDLGDEQGSTDASKAIKDELELVGDATRKSGFADIDAQPILDVLAALGIGDGLEGPGSG